MRRRFYPLTRVFARAAWVLSLLLCGQTGVHAREGSGHPDASALDTPQLTANSVEPGSAMNRLPGLRGTRLADGSVFLPKPAQFKLGIRCERADAGQHESTLVLQGAIVADPNHSAVVASIEKGILGATPQGFPVTGTRVSRGQTLAYVQPMIEAADRIKREAALTRVDQDLKVNEQSLAQLGLQLNGQFKLTSTNLFHQNLLTERRTIEIRKRELEHSLFGRNATKAPLSGEISLANAQIGMLVSPGQTLFEIIDPTRLWVEVQSYDVVPTEIIGQASAHTRSGETLELAFEGQGLKTREQALPLDFRITRMPGRVYVGQPVAVSLRTRSQVSGIVLPQSSLSRAPDGSAQVWLQTAAERYAARPVQTQFLQGGRVLIKAGLTGGERVVSQGAWLLDQIR